MSVELKIKLHSVRQILLMKTMTVMVELELKSVCLKMKVGLVRWIVWTLKIMTPLMELQLKSVC